MSASSLLVERPKTYAKWWTFVPVLPPNSSSHEYRILRRLWADHTMNCLSNRDGAWKLSSSRGFYVENREDHIAAVLFHIWALFPDVSWVSPLLDSWGLAHGNVTRARWSYSWEQKRDRASRPNITDIVLCYEDELGQGVIVVEAKRPRGHLKENDLDGGARYLAMPSIRPFERKRCLFLVDRREVATVVAKLPRGTAVASWQDMGELQAGLAAQLDPRPNVRTRIAAYVARHYADLGMSFDAAAADLAGPRQCDGSASRYRDVRALNLPSSIERFLLGSDVTFCARSGRMPEPPFEWLARELSLVDVVQSRLQSTQERQLPLWRLT